MVACKAGELPRRGSSLTPLSKRCENVPLHRTSATSGNYAQNWYIFARRPYARCATNCAKPSEDPEVCQLIDEMGAPVVVEGWVDVAE